MRNRENGKKVLELAGFVLEKEGEEEYYSMKEGNLNSPWISYVVNEINEVLGKNKKKGKQANVDMRRIGASKMEKDHKEGENGDENLSYEEIKSQYDQMSLQELELESSRLMLRLCADPDIAKVVENISRNPQAAFSQTPDPSMLVGTMKLHANKRYRALAAAIREKMPHLHVCWAQITWSALKYGICVLDAL